MDDIEYDERSDNQDGVNNRYTSDDDDADWMLDTDQLLVSHGDANDTNSEDSDSIAWIGYDQECNTSDEDENQSCTALDIPFVCCMAMFVLTMVAFAVAMSYLQRYLER